MARTSKLTPDMQSAIVKAIRGGLTYEQSAMMSGISAATFYNWKAKGDKATSGIYFEFMEALKRANVEARAINLQGINKAAQGGLQYTETSVSEKRELDPATGEMRVVATETKTTTKKTLPVWTANAWLLERRFPTEFGRHISPAAPDDKDPMDEWLEALREAETKNDD